MNTRGRHIRLTAVLVGAAVITSASCTPRGSEREASPTRRTLSAAFPPDTAPPAASPAQPVPAPARTPPTLAAPRAGDGATPASSTAPSTSTGATPPTGQAGATFASLVDPAGDVTPSPADPPPAWADLLGARLTRSAAGFELRVRLGGGAAPTQAGDDDHTMNLASFYDVDGDGHIDYEVWANVASRGWGSAYFDNTTGSGGYQERSGIAVEPEGDEIVLRFPLGHLGEATAFRWSIASEWGRYSSLGSPLTARDAMPDNGSPARFPG